MHGFWLVDNSTSGRIFRFTHAYKAWEYLKQTHTINDVAYIHNLQMKVMNFCEGDKFINEFVAGLDQLYDEMSIFGPKFVDLQDIILWEKYIQRDKFYKFIIGLRTEYDEVEASLFYHFKVLQMSEAIAEIKMKENRLNLSKDRRMYSSYLKTGQ